MRWRLLAALLAFGAAAVIGFAGPLLMATSASRTQQLMISRTADLDRFAVLADQAITGGDIAPLAGELNSYTNLYGEALLVVDTRHRMIVGTGGLSPAQPEVASLIDAALRNEPAAPVSDVLPWSRTDVLLAQPVGSDISVTGAIVLRASVRSAANDVAGMWAVIGGGAVLAGIACTGLALVVSRWVLRPVRELEDGMRATAAGTARAHVRPTGPPELRALETEFNRMSDAVADAAAQQRRLVADASHQLRNPMTALRLRMDTLGVTPELSGSSTYHSAMTEVERLESLLDGLLAQAIADSKAIEPAGADRPGRDLATVVGERMLAWQSAADHAGVALRGPADVPVITAACPDGDLAQILDVLLDNAIKYAGRGATVAVDVLGGPDDVRLRVADDGPGLTVEQFALATRRFWRGDHNGAKGTGLGLSIAESLVAAGGGRLTLGVADPHGLAVHIELPVVAP